MDARLCYGSGMKKFLSVVGFCIVAGVGGCAQAPSAPPTQSAAPPPASPCASVGGAPMLEYQLFFGRAIAGRGDLTDREWQDFAEKTITPRLPAGFTVFDAYGQEMNPVTQRIIKERTKVLMVAVPDKAETATAIAAIRDAYRTQFHQRSVFTVVQQTCSAY